MARPRALQEWRARWATHIRAARPDVLHMSQPQLARYLGTTQPTVAMWESARNVPNDLMKIRVIALLGLDPRQLFRPLDADPVRRRDQ